MKSCNVCKTIKPLTEFYKRSNRKCGVQSFCKSCHDTKNRAYNAANVEKLSLSQKAWYVKNRERELQKHKKYASANPERYQLYKSRRRVLIANNGVFLVTRKEVKRLLSQLCYLCNASPSTALDHITPITKGGRHSIGNLIGACKSCNSSKNNSFLSVYRKRDVMLMAS